MDFISDISCRQTLTWELRMMFLDFFRNFFHWSDPPESAYITPFTSFQIISGDKFDCVVVIPITFLKSYPPGMYQLSTIVLLDVAYNYNYFNSPIYFEVLGCTFVTFSIFVKVKRFCFSIPHMCSWYLWVQQHSSCIQRLSLFQLLPTHQLKFALRWRGLLFIPWRLNQLSSLWAFNHCTILFYLINGHTFAKNGSQVDFFYGITISQTEIFSQIVVP